MNEISYIKEREWQWRAEPSDSSFPVLKISRIFHEDAAHWFAYSNYVSGDYCKTKEEAVASAYAQWDKMHAEAEEISMRQFHIEEDNARAWREWLDEESKYDR